MVIGLVNAFGNLGGFAGPVHRGLAEAGIPEPGDCLRALSGQGLLIGAALAFLLPKAKRQSAAAS